MSDHARAARAVLEGFYAAHDRHSAEGMRAYFRPDAVFRDHRPVGTWNGNLDEYLAMIEGFWALVPDSRVVRLEVLRAEPDRTVHVVTIVGTDTISGGMIETHFSVVAQGAGGLAAACDFFPDEQSALTWYDGLGE